jgi:hypothetical protein
MRFDRNEPAGAFGETGMRLPLAVGPILVAQLDRPSR